MILIKLIFLRFFWPTDIPLKGSANSEMVRAMYLYNKGRMSVCLFVCHLTPPKPLDGFSPNFVWMITPVQGMHISETNPIRQFFHPFQGWWSLPLIITLKLKAWNMLVLIGLCRFHKYNFLGYRVKGGEATHYASLK